MSSPLSEVDRELLGEISYNNGTKATMAEANGGPGLGTHEYSHGAEFTPLNATAGTLVKVSSNGDELQADEGTNMDNTKPAPKTPKKRGAAASANDDSAQPTKKRSPTKKATAATNAETNINGEASDPITPSSKKRASPKKKSAADPNVETVDGETIEETEGPEPVTPKKGKRVTAKGKATKADNDVKIDNESAETTDKSLSPIKGNGESNATTVHNMPRKRQAPKKELAAPRGIPSSWDNADHADRMMVTMKEKGEGWAEIRAAWKEATGQDTASSTLPNRYNRIKVNMMRMKEGDDQHLLLAKKEIEDAYNTGFWANVAANMERRGADKYPSAFLQKTFKELEAAGKATINPVNGTAATGAEENDAIKEEDTGEGDDA
ncbi:hypothetical protein HO133_002929 [Letharia lupina]|uniref:Myb-like domain-containing protein n=1 Tax=Letharia lupina TaxID=560253 RepID=A0A8H6CC63_9LECA|nr:uncharacterized protein HO133_002929 [Letharia lupina]KAF6220496.1 hypothetical protein HO133_002929 [Letharia lupina]